MTENLARGLAMLSLLFAHAAHAQAEAPQLPAPGLPSETEETGPRTALGAQQPDPEIVAALRREYEDLRRRESELAALNGPATPETQAELTRVTRELEKLSANYALERWKAESMVFFRDALSRAGDLTLPAETPQGLKLALAPAVAVEGASYYSAPDVDSAATHAGATQRTTVLHVADATPFSLVWVPGVGFAFVLLRFLEVYH